MKRRQNKTGFTLVEILVVVAIIVILVTIVISIAARIDTQGKEQLTKNTFALLTAALEEFGDYGYHYSDPNYVFPLDCNGFSGTDLENELQTELGTIVSIGGGTHDPSYSGCEVMYFFLSRIPDCRETLDRIDRKLVTNLDVDKQSMIITIDPGPNEKVYPLFRVIDPWGKPLQYSYYRNTAVEDSEPPSSEPPPNSPRAFPVITSAGPDKEFGTADDITSRD